MPPVPAKNPALVQNGVGKGWGKGKYGLIFALKGLENSGILEGVKIGSANTICLETKRCCMGRMYNIGSCMVIWQVLPHNSRQIVHNLHPGLWRYHLSGRTIYLSPNDHYIS